MSTATEHAHAHDEHHHSHTSSHPIWAGLGIGLSMFSLLLFKSGATPIGWTALLLGVAMVVYGLSGWIREMTQEHVIAIRNKISEEFPNIGLWGMIIFIPSEVFLFGSLFASYFVLKAANPDFFVVPGHEGNFDVFGSIIPAVNTFLLVTSSFTLHFAEHFLKHANQKMFQILLGITLVLGFLFVGGQVYEYYEFIVHEHFDIFSGPYGAMFYSLTGLHGLHVTGGALFLLYVFVTSFKGSLSVERHSVLTSASIYWHFVDVVWIFLMMVIYLRLL